MIQSMTGYGKVSETIANKKVTIEIKSLNSKSLDLSTRITNVYREKEIEIRNAITKSLERGKVDFSMYIEKTEEDISTLPIDENLIQSYYNQLKEISYKYSIPEPSDWLQTLLRMPDVMSKTETSVEISEEEWSAIFSLLDCALEEIKSFRKQEGEALHQTMISKIENIRELLRQVEPFEKERVEKVKEKIVESLEKYVGVDYDKSRLEQELIYYIEKLDINEEKQRLSNHLDYFISTMKEDGALGKKLGFIAQEMGREINTLGSKSNNANMQKIVVQMKDELEQIKEQVLNIL